jgi:hypothetical protein
MRPPATVLGAGLSAAAAVLLLTGCGGSDDEPATSAAPSSSSATSGSPATGSSASADDGVQGFCDEAEAAFTRVANAFSSATDTANVTSALDQGVAAFDEVEPPAEISSDWSALQQGLVVLRDAVAGTDVSTPEGQAALQGAVTTFQNDAAAPQQNLEQYLTAHCDDLDVGTTPAPSS